MPYLTITRLRLKSRLMTPGFLIANEPVFQQLMQSEGYLGGKTLLDFGRGAWTISLWKDQESIRKFFLSGAHKKMMPMLNHYADEGATCTVEYGLYKLPSWKAARDVLSENANFSAGIKNPSTNHRAAYIPRLWFPLFNRPLKPKLKRLSGVVA